MELRELIAMAQGGDEQARTELIKRLRKNGAMKQLSRYLYRNRLLEPDEVRGEFWLGIARGLNQVKYDIGNPLQYLIQRGLWQVQSALRRMIGKGVFYRCGECGYEGRLRKIPCKCHRCGADADTYQREIPFGQVPEIHIEKTTTSIRIDIEKFRLKLSPKENEVMTLLLSGLHKGAERGYMRKIAELMGTTPQCVNIRLKNIRKKLHQHMKG